MPLGRFGVGSQVAMLDSLMLTGPCRSTSPRRWRRESQFSPHCRLDEGCLYYTTIYSTSHGQQYIVPYSLCLTLRQGISAPDPSPKSPHGVLRPRRGHLCYPEGVATCGTTFWSLRPFVECPTPRVPSRNVSFSSLGQALPATGDPLRLCLMPSGCFRRAASGIDHSLAAAILLIPGKSHPPASECRQRGLICLGNCSVVRNKELFRSRENLVTGAVALHLPLLGPWGASILGFSLVGCQRSWLSQVIVMFRRLTLNSHDDVAPTVVALGKRASLSSAVGPFRVSCCKTMQRQVTLFTRLQEPKDVRSTTVSEQPPLAWLTASNEADFDRSHAFDFPWLNHKIARRFRKRNGCIWIE